MMFLKSVSFKTFKENASLLLSKVTKERVIQLVPDRKGESTKVIMTTEHYLQLLNKIASFEPVDRSNLLPHKTPEEIKKDLLARTFWDSRRRDPQV